ncbi:hypothetical protein [Aquimarina hainanensis]|uniref:hypothetical protein n=1 Tax=Aquimarina hainanensis TaxID=1578017 RepID=UPI00360EC6B6
MQFLLLVSYNYNAYALINYEDQDYLLQMSCMIFIPVSPHTSLTTTSNLKFRSLRYFMGSRRSHPFSFKIEDLGFRIATNTQ